MITLTSCNRTKLCRKQFDTLLWQTPYHKNVVFLHCLSEEDVLFCLENDLLKFVLNTEVRNRLLSNRDATKARTLELQRNAMQIKRPWRELNIMHKYHITEDPVSAPI